MPLAELATLEVRHGPSMIRNENGFLSGYVFVDVAGRDIGSWVEDAKAKVAAELRLPAGTTLLWSGQWENMVRVRERLSRTSIWKASQAVRDCLRLITPGVLLASRTLRLSGKRTSRSVRR